ncbi:MAG: DUF4743 domain-containing protein [Pseudomonadota bacterium]|nr:DUF4743 domain-containing protein [Pseudomonadota bacterium]
MIDSTRLRALNARLSVALAAPPGVYVPLSVDRHCVGWTDPARASRLAQFSDVFTQSHEGLAFVRGLDDEPSRTAGLGHVTRALADEGLLSAWRDETYTIASAWGAPALFLLERAAARYFGVVTYAAHINGLVAHSHEMHMWFARRSATKAIDPGQLDTLVGGGIRSGTSVEETVLREAWEEAGIHAATAARALPTGAVRVCRAGADGLQREIIFVHDLALDPRFAPNNIDGEAVEHRLVTIDKAAEMIARSEGCDLVTVDASLVVLDYLLRSGSLSPRSPDYLALAALRWSPLCPGQRSARA